jgi:hypothetical protein
MFNTGNPTQDANNYINWLDKQPSALAESRRCDLCDREQDLIDMAYDKDCGSYYCEECVKDGDVASYLRRNEYTEDMILKIVSQIK